MKAGEFIQTVISQTGGAPGRGQSASGQTGAAFAGLLQAAQGQTAPKAGAVPAGSAKAGASVDESGAQDAAPEQAPPGGMTAFEQLAWRNARALQRAGQSVAGADPAGAKQLSLADGSPGTSGFRQEILQNIAHRNSQMEQLFARHQAVTAALGRDVSPIDFGDPSVAGLDGDPATVESVTGLPGLSQLQGGAPQTGGDMQGAVQPGAGRTQFAMSWAGLTGTSSAGGPHTPVTGGDMQNQSLARPQTGGAMPGRAGPVPPTGGGMPTQTAPTPQTGGAMQPEAPRTGGNMAPAQTTPQTGGEMQAPQDRSPVWAREPGRVMAAEMRQAAGQGGATTQPGSGAASTPPSTVTAAAAAAPLKAQAGAADARTPARNAQAATAPGAQLAAANAANAAQRSASSAGNGVKSGGAGADTGKTSSASANAQPSAASAITQAATGPIILQTAAAPVQAGLAMKDGGDPSLTGQGNLDAALHPADAGRSAGTQTAQAQARTAAQTGPRIDAAAIARLAKDIGNRAANGGRRFEIRMDPPELGKVEVKLEISHDKKARAVMLAERPETLGDLERAAKALQKALAESGLELEQDGLEFGLQQDQAGGDEFSGHRSNGQSRAPSGGALTADISEAATQAAPAEADAYGFRLRARPRLSVNV